MIARGIKLTLETTSRANAAAHLRMPGDAVLISRGTPRWLILRCPCGCGEEVPVNLDPRSGKAWRLYRSTRAGLTLFPSVWRDTGCGSHFVIWRDHILMLGGWDLADREPVRFDVQSLSERVLAVWPGKGYALYVDVADALKEIPWDVQDACRWLVKKGMLEEANGTRRGWYKKVRP